MQIYSDIHSYCFFFKWIYSNIRLYHFFVTNIFGYSKIQPLASNLKLTSKIWYECILTFEYFPIWIFVRIIFISFFWYEYIRIFIRIAFLIRIYSDIRSYHLFDTNIFGYSFVSFLDINIFEYSFVSKIYIRHTLLTITWMLEGKTTTRN